MVDYVFNSPPPTLTQIEFFSELVFNESSKQQETQSFQLVAGTTTRILKKNLCRRVLQG